MPSGSGGPSRHSNICFSVLLLVILVTVARSSTEGDRWSFFYSISESLHQQFYVIAKLLANALVAHSSILQVYTFLHRDGEDGIEETDWKMYWFCAQVCFIHQSNTLRSGVYGIDWLIDCNLCAEWLNPVLLWDQIVVTQWHANPFVTFI